MKILKHAGDIIKLSSEQTEWLESTDGDFIKSGNFEDQVNQGVAIIIFVEDEEHLNGIISDESQHEITSFEHLKEKGEKSENTKDAKFENYLVVHDDYGNSSSVYIPLELLKC